MEMERRADASMRDCRGVRRKRDEDGWLENDGGARLARLDMVK